MKPIKSEFVAIRKSGIHNKGAFAAKDIPKGAMIIQYLGEKVPTKEGDRRAKIQLANGNKDSSKGHDYIFQLNSRQDIDGSPLWNTARYVNHSCTPNCDIEVKKNQIWYVSKRKISKGEELFINYGYGAKEYANYPCRCLTKNCLGYIVGEDYRKELTLILKKNGKLKHGTIEIRRPSPSKYMIIRQSKIHNKGAFAKIDIPKNARVVEYCGEIVSVKEGTRRSEIQFKSAQGSNTDGQVYVFELNKKQDIDGSPLWNTARYINHSCTPNCRIQTKNNRIWIISNMKILKGEEIFYDYGYDEEDYHEHPCKCGTKNCDGYIVGAKYKKALYKLMAKNKKLKSKNPS